MSWTTSMCAPRRGRAKDYPLRPAPNIQGWDATQPCVLKPPLEHKRPCAPGLVSQTHAFSLGMHAVHNGPIGRRQQPQKRRVRLTQLDGHGAVVHRTDAAGTTASKIQPQTTRPRVAQPLQGKDHVGCVDGTSVRESDPRPEVKRVGVGDEVNLPRFRHTRDNFEVAFNSTKPSYNWSTTHMCSRLRAAAGSSL